MSDTLQLVVELPHNSTQWQSSQYHLAVAGGYAAKSGKCFGSCWFV